MNTKLLHSCALAWSLGLVGMWVSRAVLALDLSALPFQISARVWLIGGVGYTALGLLGVVSPRPDQRRAHAGPAGDLAALSTGDRRASG